MERLLRLIGDVAGIASVSWALCLSLALVSRVFPSPGAFPDNHRNPAGMEKEIMRKDFISRVAGADGGIRWLCYYGSNRDALALPGYKLLVLEADAMGPLSREDKGDRLCVAYMSIGEISQNRWFWPLAQGKPWILEENPDWPGALRVDPRAPEWSDLLVNVIAPALLAQGVDGFMLDNVDIGEYLENRDPDACMGAKDAVVNIIQRLREAFPEAALIANGGLETAADAAGCLDAVIRESVFSRWTPNADGSISYREVSPRERAWILPGLLRVRAAGLPILNLEYVAPEDAGERRRVWDAARKSGYHPYLAERDLMRLPDWDALPLTE